MAADYYCADSENGDHIDDPSEDALLGLISDLNGTDTASADCSATRWPRGMTRTWSSRP
ncbi:hypothetical protein [Streptomyces violaceusniger]|uniref:Uncharacterized protein n=1 Tax=Streptomyces violaceusniger TaxID=68280 RepID=A0A4D4KU99_STRVO|nr:hypothetical protein SVIO_007730 [Streptomyces violaceusniger]